MCSGLITFYYFSLLIGSKYAKTLRKGIYVQKRTNFRAGGVECH